MKHIAIKLLLLAIGNGVKLTHTYTTKYLREGQRKWLSAHFAVTQAIMQQAARESGSGIPSRVRRSSADP